MMTLSSDSTTHDMPPAEQDAVEAPAASDNDTTTPLNDSTIAAAPTVMAPTVEEAAEEAAAAPPMPAEAATEASPTASAFPTLKEKAVQPLGRRSLEDEAPLEDGGEAASEPKKRVTRKRWYIVHTYSGHENKVKINLERRIESMNMGHKIFSVEVPQKTVTKIKDGKRQEKDERLFPGYVLVEMLMDDDSWYVVRHTPGVTKFIGSEKKPVPAKDSEVRRILMRNTPITAKKVEIDIKIGEPIRIISGPFSEFEGTVTEVFPEKEKIKANVSIFGRDTPVELHFGQIQKMD